MSRSFENTSLRYYVVIVAANDEKKKLYMSKIRPIKYSVYKSDARLFSLDQAKTYAATLSIEQH